VVTETHDLENWCMHDVIGLEHGTCVEHGGALVMLVGNDNDRNEGFVGGIRVEEVFRRSSDISLRKVAGGNGGAEQWWVGHHRRLCQSRPLIVLWKERD